MSVISHDLIWQQLYDFILSEGAADCGITAAADFDSAAAPLPSVISVVVPLSPAVIDEITDKPTHTYFNHYRSLNFFIDQLLLKIGLRLQKEGFRYITVAASQSIPAYGEYSGRYSHKKAAVLAGLGFMGKSNLFLHKSFGPLVRLGTIFTDLQPESGLCRNASEPAETSVPPVPSVCSGCGACIQSCPSGAISESGFNPKLCSDYMKKEFQLIGRGSVCGICIKVCKSRFGGS